MKNFGVKFIGSIILVAVSVTLILLKFYLLAALGCLAAFGLNIREIKFYSTIYQFINFRVQVLLLGYSIDMIIGQGY